MNGAAMASFQSAAETPDRDDEMEMPEVECANCGVILGSYPVGVYADCEECGGFTLSQWHPEPEGPSDEEIARRDAAWAEATLRGHVAAAVAERDTARSALDGLVAAVRAVGSLVAEHGCSCDCDCAHTTGEHTSACDPCLACRMSRVVSPLLSAAPAPTTVPAPLVRAYLAAADEWERERSAPVARTVARAAMIAARAALAAALERCP